MVDLAPLPDIGEHLVIVGTSCRKPLNVLQSYLASLEWQELPRGVRFSYVLIADWPEPCEASNYLIEWAKVHDAVVLSAPTAVGDYNDMGPVTHEWQPSAMARVGRNKNQILTIARQQRAEAVWLVDADLICDRTTFWSLWHSQQSITCAVYFTYWNRVGLEVGQLHAAPQVWLTHPYNLAGRGLQEWEFRDKLVKRELTQVWGQGACTLIRKDILAAGIDFSYLPDVPQDGMMAGEDRHFCIQAERKHKPMWADAWPDIFHIYHPSDHARIPEMVTRLGTVHPNRATVGDAVSLSLTSLEPVPTPNGLQHYPTEMIRGRLGGVTMLPELEEAIATMDRGESAVVSLHYPISFPLEYFRGRKRLVRLTVIDVKPWGFAPVLEQELFLGKHSGTFHDQTKLTEQQVASIANG